MTRTERLRAILRSPMAWILIAVLVLHTVGLGWGLPASDGWDNDGVAPRDFLPGLAETFTPGHYYTYPPVHLALLAIVTLPITIVGAMRSASFGAADLVAELIKPGYMTAIAYVARSISVVMSLGIVLFAARIAEELRALELGVTPDRRHWLDGDCSDPRVVRVGFCTAVFVGLEATLTYYAHTTNLDVPYLFWATWSLAVFVQAVARSEPRRLRRAFVLAVLAVGTKDQAYAMFLLAVPIALVIWALLDAQRRVILREAAIALGAALALFLVVDAVVFNPTGFIARVHFLTGSASQDFVEYTRDASGRVKILADAARLFDLQFPYLFAPLIALGAVQALTLAFFAPAKSRGRHFALALLPLLVAISFTVAFNWTSLRTNARFLLPQAVMFALYGGRAAASLIFAPSRTVRIAASVLLAFPIFLALRTCVAVDANLLFDPRYEAETWLREHVAPGETIETYGLNVYLPRFPASARVLRVGPEPLAGRNPLPGVTEVQGEYEDAPTRDARWIVLSFAWGFRYFPSHAALPAGRQLAPTLARAANDDAASRWFMRLLTSGDVFFLTHESKYPYERSLPLIDVHGATGRPIWIFDRKLNAPVAPK